MTSILQGKLAAELSKAIIGANVLYPVTIARPGGATQTGSYNANGNVVGPAGLEFSKYRDETSWSSHYDQGASANSRRSVLLLASSLAWPPKMGDVVTPDGRQAMVVNQARLDAAGATWVIRTEVGTG